MVDGYSDTPLPVDCIVRNVMCGGVRMVDYSYVWLDEGFDTHISLGDTKIICDCKEELIEIDKEEDGCKPINYGVNLNTMTCPKCKRKWMIKAKMWVEEIK